jgi:FixJ family two-component response regulator
MKATRSSPSDAQPDPGVVRGTVYLVEDEESVRRSLGLLLRLHGYATGEFTSAEEFLARGPRARPACALVDVRLPGISGLALQARLARDSQAPPVLLMSAHGDAALARAALLQGASDFLEKPVDQDELYAAVQAALRADAGRLEVHRPGEGQVARLAMLTREERRLFDEITGGRQAREIAGLLGISPAEVQARQARLMDKLDIRRLAELCRLRLRVDAGPRPRCSER